LHWYAKDFLRFHSSRSSFLLPSLLDFSRSVKTLSMSNDDDAKDTIDVFTFMKKSFRQKRPVGESDSDSDHDHDSILFSKRTRPSVSLVQRLEADDDDDSDIEISTKPKSTDAADFHLLDDDSSDDEQLAILPTRILEGHSSSMESIRKARMARESLQKAQTYHAEDIPEMDEGVILDFDLPDRNLGSKLSVNVRYLNRCMSSTFYKLEPLQKALDRLRVQWGLGNDLELVLQYFHHPHALDLTKTPASHQISNGATLILRVIEPTTQNLGARLILKLRTIQSSKLVSEDEFVLREREPFSNLVVLYKKRMNLAVDKVVSFSFEGEALQISQTPQSHDMEAEDIIEVTVK
jgi:hypothetical protein